MRSNGTSLEAQVLDVKGTQIFYKKWAERDGPTVVLSTEYVQYILYQNGVKRTFEQHTPAASTLPVETVNLGQNIVSVRPADLIFTNLTLAYERLLRANRLGIKVPVTVGINHRGPGYDFSSAYYQHNKVFSTGLEVNFYLSPAERFRYFVGPAVQWGRFRYLYVGRYDYTGGQPPQMQNRVGQHWAVLANAGVWYQINERLVFTADGGVGWQTKKIDRNGNTFIISQLDTNRWFRVSGNLNLGYQF
ncbi:hypothetical protein [Hymenobacter jejuensis]|uniref:DUF3575 domain-containing protein n=1 Tax=Hymenobacter jejuensis TaxID=2502781 RepID=A0A5B8A342_9BACT|nr:hypothetical protein [Hymenobacter jejuensis]QDA61738.1 hypothetical protein FHG12_17280 [Hymenobacter jejuensis]